MLKQVLLERDITAVVPPATINAMKRGKKAHYFGRSGGIVGGEGGGGVDRISGLPDEILTHILSFLPTKYAVGTSILSSRWKNLWTSVPVLNFGSEDYLSTNPNPSHSREAFCYFVDKVLSANTSPHILKFRLHTSQRCRWNDLSHFNSWISSGMRRNVTEIDLYCSFEGRSESLLFVPCESLQVLRIICRCPIDMANNSRFFGNLRKLSIGMWNSDNDLPGKLFMSSFPRLEELRLAGQFNWHERKPFPIVAPSLKILELILNVRDFETEILIDAPRLACIRHWDRLLLSYTFKNQPNISEAKISIEDFDLAERPLIRDNRVNKANRAVALLRGLCNAKSLSLCAGVVRALTFARYDNLLTFHFLTRLELMILDACGWNVLPHFLESAPNLETLVVIKKENIQVPKSQGRFFWSTPVSLPTSLLLHHNRTEIRKLEMKEELSVKEKDKNWDSIECKRLTYTVYNYGLAVLS